MEEKDVNQGQCLPIVQVLLLRIMNRMFAQGDEETEGPWPSTLWLRTISKLNYRIIKRNLNIKDLILLAMKMSMD